MQKSNSSRPLIAKQSSLTNQNPDLKEDPIMAEEQELKQLVKNVAKKLTYDEEARFATINDMPE